MGNIKAAKPINTEPKQLSNEELISKIEFETSKKSEKLRKEKQVKDNDKKLMYSSDQKDINVERRHKSYDEFGLPTFKNLKKDGRFFIDRCTRTVMDENGTEYQVMSLDEIKLALKKDHGIKKNA